MILYNINFYFYIMSNENIKSRRNKLFNDGKRKECGKCHEIKSYKFFRKRQGRLRSICEDCRNKIYAITNFKKQIKIINSLFNGRCNNCHAGLYILPALEFHHKLPSKKNYTWRDLRRKNINEIIRLIKKEDIQVLCRNCHTLKGYTNFAKFKGIILSENISKKNLKQIDEFILDELKNNVEYQEENNKGAQHRARIKYRIKKWIKKRLVIKKLYDGACIGCKKLKLKEGLPALEFHHRNPSKKEIKWENISKFSTNKIITILKDENCVCLCKNCHSLIYSINFELYSTEIFGKEHEELTRIVKENILMLKEKINTFDFKL